MPPATQPRLDWTNRQRSTPFDLAQAMAITERALPLCLKSILPGNHPLRSLEEISLIVVGDRTMAKVHRDFLDIPGTTDVITFPYGEILICAAEAHRNAEHFGQEDTTAEIALYAIHGLLHLAGYDDTTPQAFKKMKLRQDAIFAKALS